MAMSMDEEYVQSVIDSSSNTGELEGKPTPPPLTEWSQQAELLRRVIGEVEALKLITIAVNSKKKGGGESRPVLGPVGIMSSLLKRKRYANHYALRAKLMPDKYGPPKEDT